MECDTGHSDVVNALQLDYYGRRVATASTDHTIRVFDVTSDGLTLSATLQGHAGPVWDVAWAHPKYGAILASCAFDNSVVIWKEASGSWMQIYQSPPHVHSASVNGVSWAAHEAGLILASASADGSVAVFECQADGSWSETKVPAVDALGCTSISWASAGLATALSDDDAASPAMRLVVGGCENFLKILSRTNGTWRVEQKLMAHTDWVLDVAWAPSMTAPRPVIASGGRDGKVVVWKERSKGVWDHHVVTEFPRPVPSVLWSETGSVLHVMDANQSVTQWRENHVTHKWTQDAI